MLDFAPPYARVTSRLYQAQTSLGAALGGQAGARLAEIMGLSSRPDTLLRRIKAIPAESTPPPRYVGIDDWAWRKGYRYDTIVVDLERLFGAHFHKPVPAWNKARRRATGKPQP